MDVLASMLIFIGSFSSSGAEGISVAEFDPASGAITELRSAARAENPTFLARHPKLPIVYAVNELGGPGGGFVSAFAVENGTLRLLERVPSGGNSPCHIEVNPAGGVLVVAHYGGPGVTSFKLDERGIPHLVSKVAHSGSSVNRSRQTSPHPHAVHFSPDGSEVFVPDLGTDRVEIYQVDSATGKLERSATIAVAPGSGPRHLAFDCSGRAAFVVHELSSEVEVFKRGEEGWKSAQKLSTLPPNFTSSNTAAEIALHPSGRFLFVSNRGANTIAAFNVKADSSLEPISQTSAGGKTPRHFAIAPGGHWLLAGNQDSASISRFRIDSGSGALAPDEPAVPVPGPACILFYPR
jgi:6-phosphogluconolactonase